MTNDNEPEELSAERDAEIGQQVFIALQHMIDTLARRQGINARTSTDYVLAGAILAAADRYELDLAATREVVDMLLDSMLHGSLAPETRH